MSTAAMIAHNAATPERSLTQRLDALNRANDVRTKRAKLKKDLKAGRESIHDLLLDPPEYLLTAKVFDLLLAVPKYGRVKVNKIVTQCRVSPSKTIGGLSERQRNELVRLLRGYAPPAAPRPPAQVGLVVHALALSAEQPPGGVRSACNRVVPADRATLLPSAVTCEACQNRRRLR